MTTRKINSLDNLIDFMVEDIMSMSDEEILAETDPADIEKAKQAFARALEAATMEAMMGGPSPKQRQTTLRARGNGFETVELDGAGNVIEPVRCICGRFAIMHLPNCPMGYAVS